MRWEGSAMLPRSPRCTLEAIVSQAIALIVIVALAGSDLKALRDEAGAIETIEMPGSHDTFLHACEVAAFSSARWQLSRAKCADQKAAAK